MKATRSALFFSFLLVALSGVALGYVFLYQMDFIEHNPLINLAIAGLISISVIYAFVTWVQIVRGLTQWRKLAKNFPRDEKEPKLKGSMRVFRGRLNHLISFDESERAAAVSMLDKTLEWRVRFLDYSAGLLIGLGLLGTFVGLTLTMEGIKSSIGMLSSGDGEIDAKLLVTSLAAPLGGMSTAFSSSMFGLASSLASGAMSYFLGRSAEGWVHEIEKWAHVQHDRNEEVSYSPSGAKGVFDDGSLSRLTGMINKHAIFAAEDRIKFESRLGELLQSQRDTNAHLHQCIGLFSGVNQNTETLISLLNQSLAGQQALSPVLISMEENTRESAAADRVFNANIAKVVDAVERNSLAMASCVSSLTDMRVHVSGASQGIFNALSQIERYSQATNDQLKQLYEQTGGQSQDIAAATNILRIQQEAVMSSVRELAQAKVAIVAAMNTPPLLPTVEESAEDLHERKQEEGNE